MPRSRCPVRAAPWLGRTAPAPRPGRRACRRRGRVRLWSSRYRERSRGKLAFDASCDARTATRGPSPDARGTIVGGGELAGVQPSWANRGLAARSAAPSRGRELAVLRLFVLPTVA